MINSQKPVLSTPKDRPESTAQCNPKLPLTLDIDYSSCPDHYCRGHVCQKKPKTQKTHGHLSSRYLVGPFKYMYFNFLL